MYKSFHNMTDDALLRRRVDKILRDKIKESYIYGVPDDRYPYLKRRMRKYPVLGGAQRGRKLTEWQKAVKYYGGPINAKKYYNKKTKTFRKVPKFKYAGVAPEWNKCQTRYGRKLAPKIYNKKDKYCPPISESLSKRELLKLMRKKKTTPIIEEIIEENGDIVAGDIVAGDDMQLVPERKSIKLSDDEVRSIIEELKKDQKKAGAYIF